MRPTLSWETAARVLVGVVAVGGWVTIGWLLAEALFWVTGRPPALVAYLLSISLGIACGAVAILLYARLRGQGHADQSLFDETLRALERISQGDFDIHIVNDGRGPFADVVESVNKMALELGSLEQQRQDFVSNVSHEIHS
ncbi:MAG: hypothetical protein LBU50_06830, partial [Cellulomonas sp.]|nr:hypothetical protein [Cellulomonas sp.]